MVDRVTGQRSYSLLLFYKGFLIGNGHLLDSGIELLELCNVEVRHALPPMFLQVNVPSGLTVYRSFRASTCRWTTGAS